VQAEAARTQAETARSQAEAAKAEAERSKLEAQQAAQEAARQKQEAEQAKAEAIAQQQVLAVEADKARQAAAQSDLLRQQAEKRKAAPGLLICSTRMDFPWLVRCRTRSRGFAIPPITTKVRADPGSSDSLRACLSRRDALTGLRCL
jgi:hypothetical protein